MDDKIARLVYIATEIWEIGYDDVDIGTALPLLQLYNAIRDVTGAPCEHEWIPKAGPVGGLLFTHCSKCGLERDPNDPGIKIVER